MAIFKNFELVNHCHHPKERYTCGNEVIKPLVICKEAKKQGIERCEKLQDLTPKEMGVKCDMKACLTCNPPEPQISSQDN